MNTKETDNSLFEKKLKSRSIYSGTLLNVYKDEVELPDGRRSEREWIDHPGASAVLPVFKSGEVQLIRQFRYPLGKAFYEVPAGKIDKGEDPLSTAKRELTEETGISANQWISLGAFHPVIGYSNEVIYLYLAWDLSITDNKVDEDEFVSPVRFSFQEALNQSLNGEMTDGKTVACVMRAAKWWKDNSPFDIKISF